MKAHTDICSAQNESKSGKDTVTAPSNMKLALGSGFKHERISAVCYNKPFYVEVGLRRIIFWIEHPITLLH